MVRVSPEVGTAALLILLGWMRERRRLAEVRAIALRGGVGLVATMAYHALDNELGHAQGFWDTAQYLLATYGAFEAYQIVRFNLEAFSHGAVVEDAALRPNSRLLLGSAYWQDGAQFPRFSLSGMEELKPLLAVMAAALLVERLKLRRVLNQQPLALLGLWALAKEKPVIRERPT